MLPGIGSGAPHAPRQYNFRRNSRAAARKRPGIGPLYVRPFAQGDLPARQPEMFGPSAWPGYVRLEHLWFNSDNRVANHFAGLVGYRALMRNKKNQLGGCWVCRAR